MDPRYILPAIKGIWTRERKYEFWLKVELAVLRARYELGQISERVYLAIRDNAKINIELIDQIEARVDHDVIAFIQAVQQSLMEAGVGEYKEEFHRGLTSFDVRDPAELLLLREAVSLVFAEVKKLEAVLFVKAREYKWTLMIADTHGQDAEPSTFGHLLLVYKEAISRSIRRLQHVLDEELIGAKISGAVGNYADTDPRIEMAALSYLGLKPARAETQILQRDRHAIVISTLAVLGGTIEQMCRTFWERMTSRVHELEEPRMSEQKGSSAMPGKKNPILMERLQGLARLLRGNLMVAIENINTPGWRDIAQSAPERVILSDTTMCAFYMVCKMSDVLERLVVFPEQMASNLNEATFGVWAGPQVRNALMKAGVDYETAYLYVQRTSFEAVQTKTHIRELFGSCSLSETDQRTAEQILSTGKLDSFFDALAYIREGIEHIFSQQTV
ncbi:adenylosuccinate lyase [Patescibacteria group bacterium]|nr:adenylosuccinate lyase [Patescibacteria group bacterium]